MGFRDWLIKDKVAEIEKRMVEISDQRVKEKAGEFQALWSEDMSKAEKAKKGGEDIEPKSLLFDPYQMMDALGYKERPIMMTYDTLRLMAERNPIVAAVITTRVNQVASFSSRPETPYSTGFEIRMRDKDAKPTPKDDKAIGELENFIENTGNPDLILSEERDDFDVFLRKVSRDSLTYDQMAFEVIEGRGGFPIAFYGIDAATIRRASSPRFGKTPSTEGERIASLYRPMGTEDEDSEKRRKERMPKPEDIKYVQVMAGKVVNLYSERELAFGIRNPRTTITQNGYGIAELEILVNTVTAHLWAEEYNRRFFSQGSAPKGIIYFEGNVMQDQLNSFRRQWHAQVSGVYNAWKTPIIASPAKLNYTNLQISNRQMEYSNWIEYLIKLVCAVFLIDPSEINFDLRGSATQNAPMFESGNEAKQKMSRDRGLKPFVKFMQSQLNKNLIFQLYDSKYELNFVGLDLKTEEQKLELRIKELINFKTIDEVRAEYDMEAMGEEKGGDLILNPAYVQWITQKAMQAQMGQQPGQPQGGGFDFGEESPFGTEPGEEGEGGEGEPGNQGQPEAGEEAGPSAGARRGEGLQEGQA